MKILTDKVGYPAAFSGRQLSVKMNRDKNGPQTRPFGPGE